MKNEQFGTIKFKDWMQAIVFDRFGDIKALHYDEDLITSAGKAAVASLIISGTTVVSGFEYIVIGSGNTAASTGDTTLEEEAARAKATSSRIQTSAPLDTSQLVYIFASGKPAGLNATATNTQAIEESGVINELTGGQLLARQTFSPLNIDWDGGDSLQITWKIQVS